MSGREIVVIPETEEAHWEGDTVVGKRNGKESVTLTLLEKKTQNTLRFVFPERPRRAVNTAMERLHRGIR